MSREEMRPEYDIAGGERGKYFWRVHRDRIARALWEAHPIPNAPDVTWDNLIPGEYGYLLAYRQADAVIAALAPRPRHE